jgi:hypothetical protein
MEQLRGDRNICSRIKIEHRLYKCRPKEIECSTEDIYVVAQRRDCVAQKRQVQLSRDRCSLDQIDVAQRR